MYILILIGIGSFFLANSNMGLRTDCLIFKLNEIRIENDLIFKSNLIILRNVSYNKKYKIINLNK